MIQWFLKHQQKIALATSIASLLLAIASAFVAFEHFKLIRRRGEVLKRWLHYLEEEYRDQLNTHQGLRKDGD